MDAPNMGHLRGLTHRITSEGCFQSIGANMKIEVEFCKSETAILEAAFEQHRDELREHWAVDTMADMVKLLAMHGLDSLEGLAGLGDTISERISWCFAADPDHGVAINRRSSALSGIAWSRN